jgi:hypothetical protein
MGVVFPPKALPLGGAVFTFSPTFDIASPRD